MASSPRAWGLMLLGVFLILWGVVQFGVIDIQAGWFTAHRIVACLGVAAGAMLLLNR